MRSWIDRLRRPRRTGSIIVMTAVVLVVLVAIVALAVDVGYMMITRTELTVAADAAALAGASVLSESNEEIIRVAQEFAGYHGAAGEDVQVAAADVEFGNWDSALLEFTPTGDTVGNAIRVTARRNNVSFFFGQFLGNSNFDSEAQAVAVANPRDIAFVVDLSGSFNDDSEPVWATDTINAKFGPLGYPDIGDTIAQDIYDDFGFGEYPGELECIGEPIGVLPGTFAYPEMTKNGGPLSTLDAASPYHINDDDDEPTRKEKAYKWIIDNQLVRLMPNAVPTPDSTTRYQYWERYIDYLVTSTYIMPPVDPDPGGEPPLPPDPPIEPLPPAQGRHVPSIRQWEQFGALCRLDRLHTVLVTGLWQEAFLPGLALGQLDPDTAGRPPEERGYLPPSQYWPRIWELNNPNYGCHPTADINLIWQGANHVGYMTYVQFMLDHGRDMPPGGLHHTPLSLQSADCPLRSEATAGGNFSFPPRTQPMHAARRALIAAMAVVEDRNSGIPGTTARDWVSIITYDKKDGQNSPNVHLALTGDYQAAMQACTTLQAVNDLGYTTTTDAGLALAQEHIKGPDHGGLGRRNTNKLVILLTDGAPNDYASDAVVIDTHINDNPSADYYGGGEYWYDAPLMMSSSMASESWDLYPVGIGLGTDYDFMDRMARLGGTSNDAGESARGSGNPADYETRLTEIFEEIINSPRVHLVQ